jgi:hypothetical protein
VFAFPTFASPKLYVTVSPGSTVEFGGKQLSPVNELPDPCSEATAVKQTGTVTVLPSPTATFPVAVV